MGLLRLPTLGFDYQAQLTITQVPIVLAAGSVANVNNIVTVTTAGAHGLTLNPAAGVPPNYFVSFTGTSAPTGVGILNGNIFRILSIPSTTTFTIYSTVTGATLTGSNIVPVFFAPFTASPGTLFSGPQPTMTVAAVTTAYPPPNVAGAVVLAQLGANANIRFNSDLLFTGPLDPITTPAAGTPAVAPVWTVGQAVSVSGDFPMLGYSAAVWAGGSAGTSTLSVIN
jgi:hypothetical protein